MLVESAQSFRFKVAGIGSKQLMYDHFRMRWSYFYKHGLKTYSSKNYVNMSEIEELQLFSAVIFPASDPVVIIKETPTYDTGIPPTTRRPLAGYDLLTFGLRSIFV